jgi:pyroglutamyl-peptidase
LDSQCDVEVLGMAGRDRYSPATPFASFCGLLMPRILITAFEPYDVWQDNSSWLALVEFTKELPDSAKIVTRRYPVNLKAVREGLARDLADNFDYALHLGQAPGAAAIRLESIGINVGGSSKEAADDYGSLVIDGPVAYRTTLPLATWSKQLRAAGIPASVSYHAGTFLCNATLYLSHYFVEKERMRTETAFIHLPVATSQVLNGSKEVASLPTTTAAAALRWIVNDLARREPLVASKLA